MQLGNIEINKLQNVGLSRSHLDKIKDAVKLNPEEVEYPINNFAYALESRRKDFYKPLAAFLFVLQNGHTWE